MSIVKDILRSNSYWVLNKSIVKRFGAEVALLLSALSEAEAMFGDEEGWFFQTGPALEEITGLNLYIQDKHLKTLKELGAVQQDNRGIPMKRHFKLDYEIILSLASENLSGQGPKICNPRVLKSANNKTINNKALNNKSNEIKKTSKDTPTSLGVSETKKSSSEGLFSTKQDKRKHKAIEIKTMQGMTNAFTQSNEVRNALNEYFKFRLKRGLAPNQWEVILADIKRVCGDDELLIIEKAESALACGYMTIIASWEKPIVQKRKKASFDNTAGNQTAAKGVANMSREEYEEFQQNLARDEKGNLLKF